MKLGKNEAIENKARNNTDCDEVHGYFSF